MNGTCMEKMLLVYKKLNSYHAGLHMDIDKKAYLPIEIFDKVTFLLLRLIVLP